MIKNRISATLFAITLSIFSLSALAINPIGWHLNRGFENPIHTGRTYTIIYTFTNNLPLQLIKPIVISKNASPQSEFTYEDQCSGQRLTRNQQCTVTVHLSPLVVGTKYLQLTISGYDNNQVPMTEQSTIAIGESPAQGIIGQATQPLPFETTLGISNDYQFTFTNHSNTNATNVISNLVQSNGEDANITSNTCMNGNDPGTLNAGQPCSISGSIIGNSTGSLSVTATLTFSGVSNSPATTSTSTNVTNPGGQGAVAASWVSPDYLPPVMEEGEAYNLSALFTNIGEVEVTFTGVGVGSFTCVDSDAQDCSGSLSNFQSSCNNSLPVTDPAAACELQTTFTAPAASDPVKTYTITASLPYTSPAGSPTTIETSGTILDELPTTRTVTLVNQCDFSVWFSLNGSAVSGYSCNSAGVGCPAGTSCNTSTQKCYWDNPSPNVGASYELAALGQPGNTNTVTIPARNYGGTQWSGNISASLLCANGNCGVAGCSNNGGASSCAPGEGFAQPATQAEITMSVNNADSYDVEVINGFHIPISMTPMYYTDVVATPNNYTCGAPGAFNAGNGFGGCNWTNATLPAPTNGTLKSSGYYRVTLGSRSCNVTSATQQCGNTGEVCGLYQDLSTKILSQRCGDFLGYWTADEVCSLPGLSSTIDNFFLCNQALPTSSTAASPPYFPNGATLYSLMACSVPTGDLNPLYNSCYLSYPGYSQSQIITCCGCVDWWESSKTQGDTINSNSNTQSCGTQIDPQWTQYIQPQIQWMKKVCPSAYTYPFDDKTSGFSCSNNLPGQPNSTGYTITFCAGPDANTGNTGKPDGINEGRG